MYMKLRLKLYLNLRRIDFVVLLSYRGPYNYYYGKVTVAISPKSSPSCIIYAPIYILQTLTHLRQYIRNIWILYVMYTSSMSYKHVI